MSRVATNGNDAAIHPQHYDDHSWEGSTGPVAAVTQFDQVLFYVDIVLMVSVIVSNVSVIYFICGQKKARTTHNITIVSISVADILVACFVMPTNLTIVMYKEEHQEEMPMFLPVLCKLNKYMSYWCKTVMIYSILAMVIDRYFKILEPGRSVFMAGRCMFFINFVWFFGAAYSIWQIVLRSSVDMTVYTNSGKNFTVKKCISDSDFPRIKNGFVAADFFTIYLLPALITMVLYLKICRHLCCLDWHGTNLKGKRRLTMSVALFVLFFSCQLPFEISETIGFYEQDTSRPTLLVIRLLESLSYSQGILNVFAYAAFSNELHYVCKKKFASGTIRVGSQRDVNPRVLLRSDSRENVIEVMNMT